MSDTVLLAIVMSMTGFVTSLLGIVIVFLKKKMDRSDLLWNATNAAALAAGAAAASASVDAAKTLSAVQEQGAVIAIIEKHGNSITEELVKVTAAQQLALGKKMGVEQEKADQAIIAKARLEGSREIQKEASKGDK